MYKLPDGWRSQTLTRADIPVNDFTLRVLSAWQQSTPLQPYTNNPLGMPYITGKSARLLTTDYAIFATMADFRTAFAAFIASPAGRNLREALSLDTKPAPVWRAIHALAWPASATETDWPSAVLDLATESTRMRLSTVQDASQRTTSGTVGPTSTSAATFSDVAHQAMQSAGLINQATRAIRSRFQGM